MALKKIKRKVQRVHSHVAANSLHQEEEERDINQQAQSKQNARKAHRLALSSPSEVVAILKGLKQNDKTQGKTI